MSEIANIRLNNLTLPWSRDQSYDEVIVQKLLREGEPLRWAIVEARPDAAGVTVDVEATIVKNQAKTFKPKFATGLLKKKTVPRDKPVYVHVVPTGYQAAIGGSLGDAMPVNLALAKLGLLITHPNTCNGGPLNLMNPDSLYYVEGHGLDLFMQGRIGLEPTPYNKIGVIIDGGLRDQWARYNILNQVEGFRAHSGAHIAGIEWTREAVRGKVTRNQSGAFVGEVKNLDTVLEAAENLLRKRVDVIAVFTHPEIKKEYWVKYIHNKAPNPVGGIEAIISHALLRRFGIPAAHAPVLTKAEVEFMQDKGTLRPEAALEGAAPFYVWSVLRGLQSAPRLVASETPDDQNYLLSVMSVTAVIAPASTMGGIPMIRAEAENIPIIGVRENHTILNVSADKLKLGNAMEVYNYLEAVGLLHLARAETKESRVSAKTLRDLLQDTKQPDLRVHGEGVCEEAGVDPATLLRPLRALVKR